MDRQERSRDLRIENRIGVISPRHPSGRYHRLPAPMRMLALQRLMSLQRDRQRRRRRQIRARNGSIASVNKRKGSPCKQDGDDDCQAEKMMKFSIPGLPEDVWRHIHSLMPVDAAARAACLSQAFRSSWRSYSKLILSSQTVKKHNGSLSRRIESIPKNHTGIGVKILRLHLHDENTCFPHIDRWLKFAVTPGIEELTLVTPFIYRKYSFPCSVLSVGVRNSIRSLHLDTYVFRATADLGPFRSLTSLCLHSVSTTGDELECLLSKSLALERLDLKDCREIVSLKIPSVLQRIEELNLRLPKHNLTCSVLSVGVRNSIRSLQLDTCVSSVLRLNLDP